LRGHRISLASSTGRGNAVAWARPTVHDTKQCSKCKETKPGAEFPYQGRYTSGQRRLSSLCRACMAIARKAYYEQNRERFKAYSRNERAANRERHRERSRNYQRMSKYGLTQDDYDALVAAQGGGCAICGGQGGMSHMIAPLVVDHCHVTGKVRALLCANCNAGLGQLGDDPERAIALAIYLVRQVDVLTMGEASA
jgi:hypothetical protein